LHERFYVCLIDYIDALTVISLLSLDYQEIYDHDDKGKKRHFWFDIAVANSLPQVTLENASRILYLDKFDVIRAHLDVVSDGANGDVTFLRLCAVPMEGIEPTAESLETLAVQLKRTKWLDPPTMDLVFDRYPWLGIPRGEIITGFVALTHAIMAKQHPIIYSKANIFETVTRKRYISHVASIAELFLDRFNPEHPLSQEELNLHSERLRENMKGDIEDSIAVEILNKMIDIVHHTLRTNIYLEVSRISVIAQNSLFITEFLHILTMFCLVFIPRTGMPSDFVSTQKLWRQAMKLLVNNHTVYYLSMVGDSMVFTCAFEILLEGVYALLHLIRPNSWHLNRRGNTTNAMALPTRSSLRTKTSPKEAQRQCVSLVSPNSQT